MLDLYAKHCELAVYWMETAAAADARAIDYQRAGWMGLALRACQQVVMARTHYQYWLKVAEEEL